VSADQGAVLGSIQAQKQGIGADEFLAQEIVQQRVLEFCGNPPRDGAVDDAHYAQPLEGCSLAVAVGHVDSVPVFLVPRVRYRNC
jgi:hypothetical protein